MVPLELIGAMCSPTVGGGKVGHGTLGSGAYVCENKKMVISEPTGSKSFSDLILKFIILTSKTFQ